MNRSEEVLTRELPPLPAVLDGSHDASLAAADWIAAAAQLITDLRYTVADLEQTVGQSRAYMARLSAERSEFSQLWDNTNDYQNPMDEHMFRQAIAQEPNL